MNNFSIQYSNYKEFKNDYLKTQTLYESDNSFKDTLKVKVYEHKTNKDKLKVVLKIIKLSQYYDLEKGMHEELMGKKLNQDYFAQTYFSFERNGKFILAMEYVEGQTLAEFIKSKSYVCIEEYSSIIKKILEGVQSALKLNIFPVDFHSKNAIINPDTYQIKFIDFGKYNNLQELLRISQEINQYCNELKLKNDWNSERSVSPHSNMYGDDVESWQNDLDHFRYHLKELSTHTQNREVFLKHIVFLLKQPLMKYSKPKSERRFLSQDQA